MPRDQQRTSETESKRTTSRRELLRRALVVLGATALVQPSGGVKAFAQETPKKEDDKNKQPKAFDKTAAKKKHVRTGKKGGDSGTLKTETPKKEGSKIKEETPKKDGGKIS